MTSRAQFSPPPAHSMLRRRARDLASATWLWLCAIGAAHAAPEVPGDRWHISAFGTVGVMTMQTSEPWSYVRDLTQRGTKGATSALVDSRLGIQVGGKIGDGLEVVTQVVAKERPTAAKASEYVEWAFLGWQPTPGLRVRLGRTSPDLFLLADVRNVGFAYPWVRPSIEYYGWMPFWSMDGVDVASQWRQGDADWNAKLAVGKGRSTVGVLDRDSHARLNGNNTIALMISRESDGLLIKASYLRTQTSGVLPTEIQMLSAGLEGLSMLPVAPVAAEASSLQEALRFGGRSEYLALGLQYDYGPWVLHAEASRVRFELGSSAGDRGYVSLGYRWRRLTGYVMASRTLPDREARQLVNDWYGLLAPVLGPTGAMQAAALGQAGALAANFPRFDQSTSTLGLRWDVLDNVALKLQVDRVHVHPAGSAAWRNSTPAAQRATVWSTVVDVSF